MLADENVKGGVLVEIDPETVSTVTSHAPGYIDKDLEVIVGLQTDTPLKRGVNPFGGIRMAVSACNEYGYKLAPRAFSLTGSKLINRFLPANHKPTALIE